MTALPGKTKKRIKTACLLLASLLAAACLFPCCSAKNERRSAVFTDFFDTVVTLTAYADEDTFSRMRDETDAALLKYHRLFDIYNEYEGLVNLATVNSRAGEKVIVDPELIDLLEQCLEYERLTNGSVNVFMGAVLELWHEKREAAAADPENASIPDEEALEAAAIHCDPKDAVIDRESSAVTLRDPLMRIDAGAVAKGFAADRIAALLEKYDVPFMLNCGGAVLTNGNKPDGSAWTAGIEDPTGEGFAGKAEVARAALSTSGSYLRKFTANGREYGHIIDPATNMPPEKLLSVSVLISGEGSAALADAVSTACFIEGPEAGAKLIESIPGASALFVLPSGERLAAGEKGPIVTVP